MHWHILNMYHDALLEQLQNQQLYAQSHCTKKQNVDDYIHVPIQEIFFIKGLCNQIFQVYIKPKWAVPEAGIILTCRYNVFILFHSAHVIFTLGSDQGWDDSGFIRFGSISIQNSSIRFFLNRFRSYRRKPFVLGKK